MYEGTDPKPAMVVVPIVFILREQHDEKILLVFLCISTIITNGSPKKFESIFFLLKSISNKDCICSLSQAHLIMVLLFQYKCIING